MNILDLFQGIATMFEQSHQIVIARIALILLGFLLVYLGIKVTLEPLIMVPMGLGMLALLLSGIGGIVGGYIVYLFKRGNN